MASNRDDILREMPIGIALDDAEAGRSCTQPRRKSARTHLHQSTPRSGHGVRKSIMHVAGQNHIDTGRTASLEADPAASGIDRDFRVARFAKGMMTQQDTPGISSPFLQKAQGGVEILQPDDPIRPVKSALNASRRIEGYDLYQPAIEDGWRGAVEIPEILTVVTEWRSKPAWEMMGQMNGGRVVIARGRYDGRFEAIEPSARGGKFAAYPVLCDIARDKQSRRLQALYMIVDNFERGGVLRSEVYV